jgi:hypothetical protein
MIYECTNGHICFSKEEDLCICAMKECRKPTLIISPIDIEWFYKINDSGLCINRKDLEMIIKDRNMPREVKKIILRIFPYLMSQMYD